ncbi:ATP-binding protein [Myxococcus sp. MxC21-1]|uniref:HD domain-containing protein n=1 Tax=Myxococcus sp. MxC21-1 TaxID=3041439 RepID=UPI00292EDB68|nr:ATP-binding protein [Myxococcus sp. MxC21-1]WNZ59758.1 ATP-binding protein [Myxococcus sp. MxC21-1]
MPLEFKDFPLIKFLKKDSEYAQRLYFLRKELDQWLQHTADLFPHYTSHARDHSEQIILQLSNLLFKKGKPTAREFSQAEAYVLACAAYLHDAGMVVSPAEIESTLGSARWEKFLSTTPNGKTSILEILKTQNTQSSDIVAYKAGIQLRLLLAEFFRREHHQRAPLVLKLHPALRQVVDFNDRRYFEAISSIAIAHGLNRAELNDPIRFKETVDLGGEKVNIRFMARLLRIGDLLDMRSSRASPYACTAVEPLPLESKPHWKQYSTITSEHVAPAKIEYHCECQDQDTHAVLRDWFGWLCDEVRDTGLAMHHAERHSDWRPPRCTIEHDGLPPTITIQPAENANYTFHRWKLELDQEKILERLIHNVYEYPEVYIRELIQNAIDATRCRLYEDYRTSPPEAPPPLFPNHFPQEHLDKYPLSISISEKEISLPRTGEKARRHILTIEDSGIGMDSDTIRRFLLQVGRSYYQSEEFKSRYTFIPTSRFGIGFLSTFAVSNHITVETAKFPLPQSEPHGIRLTLQGPSTYLLTERWSPFESRPQHRRHGTRIQVILSDPMEPGVLTQLVSNWCQRVEIPIYISDFNQETRIVSQTIKDRSATIASATDPSGRFEIRAFRISEPGIEGEIFRVAYINNNGESWLREWDESRDLTDKPLETIPQLPRSSISLHGILHRSPSNIIRDSDWHASIDDRRPNAQTNLARTGIWRSPTASPGRNRPGSNPDLESSIEAILKKHISAAVSNHLQTEPRARKPDHWQYAGKLLSDPGVIPEMAWAWPQTTPLRTGNDVQYISANEAMHLPSVHILRIRERHRRTSDHSALPAIDVPHIPYWLAPRFLRHWINQQIMNSKFTDIKQIDNDWALLTLTNTPMPSLIQGALVTNIEGKNLAAICISAARSTTAFNSNHEIIKWLLAVHHSAERGDSVVTREMSAKLAEELQRLDVTGFDAYIEKWRKFPGMPQNLIPPSDWSWHTVYRATLHLE